MRNEFHDNKKVQSETRLRITYITLEIKSRCFLTMEPQNKKFKSNTTNIIYTDDQIKAKQVGQKNKNTIKTEERAN